MAPACAEAAMAYLTQCAHRTATQGTSGFSEINLAFLVQRRVIPRQFGALRSLANKVHGLEELHQRDEIISIARLSRSQSGHPEMQGDQLSLADELSEAGITVDVEMWHEVLKAQRIGSCR